MSDAKRYEGPIKVGDVFRCWDGTASVVDEIRPPVHFGGEPRISFEEISADGTGRDCELSETAFRTIHPTGKIERRPTPPAEPGPDWSKVEHVALSVLAVREKDEPEHIGPARIARAIVAALRAVRS